MELWENTPSSLKWNFKKILTQILNKIKSSAPVIFELDYELGTEGLNVR